MPNGKPNILILWGDDIGWFNISHNNRGVMGYRTPNIDRIAREGIEFTDYYIMIGCSSTSTCCIQRQYCSNSRSRLLRTSHLARNQEHSILIEFWKGPWMLYIVTIGR